MVNRKLVIPGVHRQAGSRRRRPFMSSVHLKQTFRSRGARCSFLGTEASLRTRAQCTEIGGTPRQPARQRLARGGQEPIVHVWIVSTCKRSPAPAAHTNVRLQLQQHVFCTGKTNRQKHNVRDVTCREGCSKGSASSGCSVA